MIRKVGSEYFVFSEMGKRLSKGFKSLADAKKRLAVIEYFKHKKK